ncbi:hypothetical protein pb186bvf_004676 [Paramecium bursaria]
MDQQIQQIQRHEFPLFEFQNYIKNSKDQERKFLFSMVEAQKDANGIHAENQIENGISANLKLFLLTLRQIRQQIQFIEDVGTQVIFKQSNITFSNLKNKFHIIDLEKQIRQNFLYYYQAENKCHITAIVKYLNDNLYSLSKSLNVKPEDIDIYEELSQSQILSESNIIFFIIKSNNITQTQSNLCQFIDQNIPINIKIIRQQFKGPLPDIIKSDEIQIVKSTPRLLVNGDFDYDFQVNRYNGGLDNYILPKFDWSYQQINILSELQREFLCNDEKSNPFDLVYKKIKNDTLTIKGVEQLVRYQINLINQVQTNNVTYQVKFVLSDQIRQFLLKQDVQKVKSFLDILINNKLQMNNIQFKIAQIKLEGLYAQYLKSSQLQNNQFEQAMSWVLDGLILIKCKELQTKQEQYSLYQEYFQFMYGKDFQNDQVVLVHKQNEQRLLNQIQSLKDGVQQLVIIHCESNLQATQLIAHKDQWQTEDFKQIQVKQYAQQIIFFGNKQMEQIIRQYLQYNCKSILQKLDLKQPEIKLVQKYYQKSLQELSDQFYVRLTLQKQQELQDKQIQQINDQQQEKQAQDLQHAKQDKRVTFLQKLPYYGVAEIKVSSKAMPWKTYKIILKGRNIEIYAGQLDEEMIQKIVADAYQQTQLEITSIAFPYKFSQFYYTEIINAFFQQESKNLKQLIFYCQDEFQIIKLNAQIRKVAQSNGMKQVNWKWDNGLWEFFDDEAVNSQIEEGYQEFQKKKQKLQIQLQFPCSQTPGTHRIYLNSNRMKDLASHQYESLDYKDGIFYRNKKPLYDSANIYIHNMVSQGIREFDIFIKSYSVFFVNEQDIYQQNQQTGFRRKLKRTEKTFQIIDKAKAQFLQAQQQFQETQTHLGDVEVEEFYVQGYDQNNIQFFLEKILSVIKNAQVEVKFYLPQVLDEDLSTIFTRLEKYCVKLEKEEDIISITTFLVYKDKIVKLLNIYKQFNRDFFNAENNLKIDECDVDEQVQQKIQAQFQVKILQINKITNLTLRNNFVQQQKKFPNHKVELLAFSDRRVCNAEIYSYLTDNFPTQKTYGLYVTFGSSPQYVQQNHNIQAQKKRFLLCSVILLDQQDYKGMSFQYDSNQNHYIDDMYYVRKGYAYPEYEILFE